MSDSTMSAMKKLSLGQAAFGNCRRLDEEYLNRALQYDDYVTIDSNNAQTRAAPGPSIPQIGLETSAFSPLELNKAIRSVNFRSLHRLLSFPLTEMISTAPPDLSSTCTSPTLHSGFGKLTPSSPPTCPSTPPHTLHRTLHRRITTQMRYNFDSLLLDAHCSLHEGLLR